MNTTLYHPGKGTNWNSIIAQCIQSLAQLLCGRRTRCVHMMGSTYGAVHFYCFPSSSEFVEKRWISRGSGWARVYPCTYFYCSYFPPCSEFIGKRPIITSSVCVWCVNTTLQYNITPQSFKSTDGGPQVHSLPTYTADIPGMSYIWIYCHTRYMHLVMQYVELNMWMTILFSCS